MHLVSKASCSIPGSSATACSAGLGTKGKATRYCCSIHTPSVYPKPRNPISSPAFQAGPQGAAPGIPARTAASPGPLTVRTHPAAPAAPAARPRAAACASVGERGVRRARTLTAPATHAQGSARSPAGAARYLLLREQLLVPPPLLLQQLPVPAGRREPQSTSHGTRGGKEGERRRGGAWKGKGGGEEGQVGG